MARKLQFEDFDATPRNSYFGFAAITIVGMLLFAAFAAFYIYRSFRVEVPARSVAVLMHKTGTDIPNDQELATDFTQKGVQLEVLREGRYFYNPYHWNWEILPQVEIPEGKVGVLIRLFGEDLPHQQLIATSETQKGIVPSVLGPGRYPAYSNPYAYRIELYDAVTIPAGFKGVETLVTGTPSKDPNRLLVDPGERGVQKVARNPGTYYLNPYMVRISQVDCRTKKLDLTDELDMGFPSRDGFWIRLGGTVQFHVDPDRAPEVFVTYNLTENDDDLYDEIVESIIFPNARSFCRLAGSSYTGRQFIEGAERQEFQKAFHSKLVAECEPLGIKIDSALITKIYPPEPIADPVRMREIAKQKQSQFKQEMLQQQSEAKLIVEKKRIEQRTRLVEAEREVIQMETKAMQEQQVAVTEAEQQLAVAKKQLEAAQDKAAAILARGKADAQVIRFNNEAEVSGLRATVEAFDGNGHLVARNALLEKLAPSYRQIMMNTADSPLMRIFEQIGAGTLPADASPPPTSVASQAEEGALPAPERSEAASASETNETDDNSGNGENP